MVRDCAHIRSGSLGASGAVPTPSKTFPQTPASFSGLCPLFCVSPSTTSASSNSSDEESLSEEELAMLMEQVEQKKKLISTMRNKPWRMVKKLSVLR